MSDHEPSFGPEVRRHRLAAGLTQDQLAAQLGITRAAVSQIELGTTARPSDAILSGLEQHLGLNRIYSYQLLGALPPPSHDDLAWELDRIAAIADEDQRVAALLALPEPVYEKLVQLAEDIQRAAIRRLREVNAQNRVRSR